MQSETLYTTAGSASLPKSLISNSHDQTQDAVDTLNVPSAEAHIMDSGQETQIRFTSVLPVFIGLATLPCHGLVDTGAQDGVC
eukprot:3591265-Karenia_brevis.AAC.1